MSLKIGIIEKLTQLLKAIAEQHNLILGGSPVCHEKFLGLLVRMKENSQINTTDYSRVQEGIEEIWIIEQESMGIQEFNSRVGKIRKAVLEAKILKAQQKKIKRVSDPSEFLKESKVKKEQKKKRLKAKIKEYKLGKGNPNKKVKKL